MKEGNGPNKVRIALIYGSTRAGRFCDTVAAWVAEQISKKPEFEISIVDPAAASMKTASNGENIDTRSLRQRIGDADAFVVVTPEYNHGYPAGLKSLIDSVGEEWQAKPVAFVSYGGISGGLRAVEQLRQVFAELHAVTVRDSVSFASAWELFDEQGKLKNPERAQRQMETMLRRLKWWANTLREGRNAVPYSPAA